MKAIETNLENWRIAQGDHNFVHLIIDKSDAEQNALSQKVVEELEQALNQIQSLSPRGIILESGKDSSFIVGADVTEFTQITSEAQALALIQKAHAIFSRLEAMNTPSVAKINGYCLGGGLELALCCDYRVAVDDNDVRIGLPEVMLGIHPGFGGTARLIEKIGATSAMDIMLSGRTLRPKQARSMGVIDMAAPERLLDQAAEHYLLKTPSKKSPAQWNKVFDFGLSRKGLANVMRKKVKARAKPEHYPAPYALIDLWEQHGGDKKRMLDEEAKSVARLIHGKTAQNLVRVFFLQERMKSLGKVVTGATDEEFKHAHVIGGGTMGGDIAAWCVAQNLQVTLQDNNPDALARATKRAHTLFKKRIRDKRGVMRAMDRLQQDVKGEGVAKADVIIEAIFENLEAKQGLFEDVEKRAKSTAVLATNTSSIPLEDIAKNLQNPNRLVGLHFFNPVAKMQLVEIVCGDNTSETETKRAAAFAKQISRLPVPVKSSPGFLVNRILTPYLMEAMVIYDEGVPGKAIDQAATKFGMPMGPIELADNVGLDICYHVAKNLTESFGGEVSPTLAKLVETKNLGKKTGRGVYQWSKGKAQKPDLPKDYQTPADIADRMILRFLNESVACLREGVVEDKDLLDAGIIFGTGFAPFRGGPMRYIEQEGKEGLAQKLEAFAEKYGERFTPDAGWADL